MKKIIAYIRVSTDEQAVEGFSIEYQKKMAGEFAKKNKLKNILFFCDEGYTATNLNRPKLKQILSLVERDLVSDIVIYDLDRLSRDSIECMNLLNLFKEKGVILHGINFSPKYESSDEKFMLRIKAIMGQLESEKIGERTLYGLKQSYEEGNYACSRAPYGYKKNNDKSLTPIASEIEIVQYIFSQYIYSEWSISMIAEGIRENYYIDMKSAKISSILSNEKYTGEFVFHGAKRKGYGLVKIINKFEFEMAKKKRENKQKFKKYDYYFSNKVFCSTCKNLLVCKPALGRKKKVYLYYACMHKGCSCYGMQISQIKLIENKANKIVNLYNKYSLINKKCKVKNINELSSDEIKSIVIKYMKAFFWEFKKKN